MKDTQVFHISLGMRIKPKNLFIFNIHQGIRIIIKHFFFHKTTSIPFYFIIDVYNVTKRFNLMFNLIKTNCVMI